jgi:hypothetical protein
MKREQSQNCSVPSKPLPTKPCRNHPGHGKKVSFFMEAEQRHFINFFVKEGVKRVEIIDRLNKYYGGDAIQRTQVCYWIREVKSGRKDLSNVTLPGRAPCEGLDDCIAKALKEDPHLLTRKIAKALNISSTMVQNHLTKSLGMKCYHMRWVPHTLTAAQASKRTEMAGSMRISDLGQCVI